MNFKKYQLKIYLLLVLVAMLLAVNYFGLFSLLSFQNLILYSQSLKDFVNQNWLLSALGFVLIYILVASFPVPGALVMTLAGGFLFGFWGIILTVIAATIGAINNFLLSRYLLGNFIQEKYADKLAKFNKQLEKDGANYLLTLHLLPIFPFFMVNTLSGLTKIKLSTFVWTTAVGIIPGTSVYIFAGRSLSNLKSPADVFSPSILLAFSILALFTLIPVFFGKFKTKT